MPAPKNFTGPKRVTLKDIAAVAGVHVMTVSDALNGTGRVASATRERIINLARELNYVPNATARALATGRTGRIALLSGAFDYPYYANLVHFLKLRIDSENYKLLSLKTPSEIWELMYTTENTEADGVIAIDLYSFGEEFGKDSSIPCVSIGPYPRKAIDCVLVDLTKGVTQGINLMFDAGCHRVAYLITSEHMVSEHQTRAQAFFSVVQKRGGQAEVINVNSGNMLRIREIFTTYVRENGAPDGLFCQNDEIAMCAFRALNDLGYRIPKDVLLLGCDGQVHMDYFEPPLSTVSQPLQKVAETAWDFLRHRMADPSLPHQRAVLQGELKATVSLLRPTFSR